MKTETFDAMMKMVHISKIGQIYPRVYLDGSFQRWGGIDNDSGWNNNSAREYLNSLVTSQVFNSIMVAQIDDCLAHAKSENDKDSIDYFEKIRNMKDDEGNRLYDYISIDGNNSSSVIYGFLNNHDEMYILDRLSGKKNQKKWFKDFAEDEQIEIQYEEKINLIELRRIGIVQMCDLFRNLNKQQSLNDQEHRQATWTELSGDIRSFGEEFKDIFLSFCFTNPANIQKRVHEEMIAQLALKTTSKYTKTLKKKGLDNFYENTHRLEEDAKKQIRSILEVAHNMANAAAPFKKRVSKGTLHNLFDAISIVQEKGFKINLDEKFLKWFLEMDARLVAMSKKVIAQDEKDKSYIYWTKFYTKPEYQRRLRELILVHFLNTKQELQDDNIVSEKRKGKDFFNQRDSTLLWALQNGLDREGNKIDIIDLYRGGFSKI